MLKISVHPGKTLRLTNLDEGFAMLRRAGIEGIQLGLGNTFITSEGVRANLPAPADGPLEELIESIRPYKEAAQKNGITISQVHAPFPMWMVDNEEGNERMSTIIPKAIAVTGYLESPYCVIHPASPYLNKDRYLPEAEWELNKKLYTSLIPHLKKHNVIALLENLFSRAEEGLRFAAVCNDYHEAARWIDDLNEIAGEERFGFCLDTGHCVLARQNLNRAVHIMGKRLLALHIHDNSGHLDDHRSPFTGIIDWESFIDSLKTIGYQGDLNFESINAISKFPDEMVEDCLRLLASTGRYFRKRLTE